MNRLLEATLVIFEGEKPYGVEVVIPGDGKVYQKLFRFSDSYDAVVLPGRYLDAYRKDPAGIIDFHEEIISQYEANELQTKFKV